MCRAFMLNISNGPRPAQVFTNKEEIAIGVKQELTKSMTGFGYAIIQVRGHRRSAMVESSPVGGTWLHLSRVACPQACVALALL